MTSPRDVTKLLPVDVIPVVLSLTVFVGRVLVAFGVGIGLGCVHKFWGPRCQYLCRCDGNRCGLDGDCLPGVKCAPYYFGTKCQYRNMLKDSNAPAWMKDGDTATCNPANSTYLPLNFTFTDPKPVTWIRFQISEQKSISEWYRHTQFQFEDSVKHRFICTTLSVYFPNNNTADLYCIVDRWAETIYVSGETGYLCDVYFSEGRNVALKQFTSQTSTVYGGFSGSAVDGERGQMFYKNVEKQIPQCTRTCQEREPTWFINFEQPRRITHIVLLNAADDPAAEQAWADQLKNFTLKAYNASRNLIFSYQDTSPNAQPVYNIKMSGNETVFSSMSVAVWNTILHICEFEAFGDTECPADRFGFECQFECHCRDPPCIPYTGVCPNGCILGYYGNTCQQTCMAGFYGQDCAHECSPFCKPGGCDSYDGQCYAEECTDGYWGLTCTRHCSADCIEPYCDYIEGNCTRISISTSSSWPFLNTSAENKMAPAYAGGLGFLLFCLFFLFCFADRIKNESQTPPTSTTVLNASLKPGTVSSYQRYLATVQAKAGKLKVTRFPWKKKAPEWDIPSIEYGTPV